ncbi:171_t:CDS:2 [Paraglomus occultum]|uniref:171_t:CDS:1 n=1 Tax=Paraglomus occultum TaxID=144539 RepID=A0A9N8ZRU7_9GLOM|nr:171_t:CDS:2 [Paraglomus occultum]
MLRNLRPDLFQSSLSRPYANSSPSPHTSPEKVSVYDYFCLCLYGNNKTAILANIIVTGLVGLISVDLLYAWYRNVCNERLLNETVENGTRPEAGVSSDKFISRPEIVERLKRIFQPYEDQSYYYMVCGEHGTGKTTLTRTASSEVGHGVIYVDVPANFNELGEAFGKAINFTFEERISFTRQLIRKILDQPKTSEWERALKAFKRASAVYKAKNGKPPVIVYDNISRLVYKNPEILDILQDDAKDNADDRKYIAVFVSSEGSVPRRMELMEIGDLSKEESMEYLTKKRKINEVEAKNLYELVGSRIIELKTVADDFVAGQSFEVIRQQILTKVEKKFDYAKLLPDQALHEAGKHVIGALIDSKEIHTSVFRKFIGDEKFGEVLGANVFAYHPSRDTVTFQSQSIEYYIQENASIFGNTQEGKRKM